MRKCVHIFSSVLLLPPVIVVIVLLEKANNMWLVLFSRKLHGTVCKNAVNTEASHILLPVFVSPVIVVGQSKENAVFSAFFSSLVNF